MKHEFKQGDFAVCIDGSIVMIVKYVKDYTRDDYNNTLDQIYEIIDEDGMKDIMNCCDLEKINL